MKKLNITKLALLASFWTLCFSALAQDTEKPELSVNLRYFNVNSNVQYLKLETKVKEDNKWQPVKDVNFNLYLDSIASENLISKVKTNEKGAATTYLPVSLKEKWNTSSTHTFIAVSEPTKAYEATTTEVPISKSRIVLDTLNAEGARSVSVTVESFENGAWVPAKEVEVKIGVQRLGGMLRIGEEESYTTDSLGQAVGEFKLDSIPATDKKGIITLMAKVDDNETFGNVSIEKAVPWGVYYTSENKYGERTLWAPARLVPYWLLFMAISIIAGVWGVIIYLIFQIIRIKKLGKEKENIQNEPSPRPKDAVVG